MKRALIALALGWSGAAFAQADRPSEADLFGGAPTTEKPKSPTDEAAEKPDTTKAATPASPTGPASRDDAILGARDAPTKLSEDVAPDNPLTIGGQFYLRALSSGQQGTAPSDWSVSSPSLLDAYFDARPNDRVRGFVLGRMFYDPTLAPNGTVAVVGSSDAAGTSTGGTQSLTTLFVPQTRGPQVLLDQFWLRFDVSHTVFVTAGKQHVRWGTGRFWSPTDYLHLTRRNPLAVFDARTGVSMLKLHLPIESRAWNFYAYLVPESVEATRTVGDVAAAARAEVLLGRVEIGAGAFVQKNRKPKWAIDASMPVWDFDVYGELGLRYGSEIDRVRYEAALPPPVDLPRDPNALRSIVDATWPVYRSSGIKPQAVGGVSYTRKYADKDTFTLGAEYFYNALGYDDARAYPGLVLRGAETALAEPATFFYLGRQYAAVFATFPAPYSLDLHTFTLTTLGNLSDKTFITRFDYSLVLLTHLRFEAFAAVHYGSEGGEFRFGFPQFTFGGQTFNAPLVDFGVALRMAI